MVHYFFGLVILAGFLIWYQRPLNVSELALFPVVVLVQLILTTAFALLLSALTVHFRDIRDILSNLLTFWFFATPIIYPYFLFQDPLTGGKWQAQLLKLNPFTHLAITYQEILFFNGPVGHLKWLLVLGVISIGSSCSPTGCSIGCRIRLLKRSESIWFSVAVPVASRVSSSDWSWHWQLVNWPTDDDPHMNAIEVVHASKVYRRFSHKRQFATLKSALLRGSLIRDLKPDETFTAVRDVTFTVPAGRTLGVIGRNGSGKSTMLKLVAGITKPTTGSVTVNGRISALIELGAGFHPEISGRENVFINGIMLGLSKREVATRFDEIVEFAELKDFIDAPVKTYSSGMYMRLGFAVAIHVDPDVLLVDEVLAVGDEGFTHKCLDKFAEFKRRGKTILLVTHALPMVERFCDEALWLDHGEKKGMGDPKRMVGAYVTAVEVSEESSSRRRREGAGVDGVSPDEPASAVLPDHPVESAVAPSNMFQAAEGRWGSREVEITDVSLSSGDSDRGRLSQRRSARHPHPPARRCRSRTSSWGSGCSTPRASAVTAPTRTSRTTGASGFRATPKSGSGSTASISSKAPTRSTSPCTSWTAIRTTTTACSTPSA